MLKQVVIAHKLAQKRKELAGLTEKRDAIEARKAEMKKREEELEAAVMEITEETADEERTAVEESVAAFEEEAQAVETEAEENRAAIEELEAAINTMQSELDGIASTIQAAAAQAGEPEETNERSITPMKIRKFFSLNAAETRDFFARQDVKNFAARIREIGKEKRAVTGGELLIPEVVLDLIREQVEASSKLLKYVNLQPVGGKGRQPVMGTIPEAVWTEMCATLNELDLGFNDVEVDGYKAGAFVAICNALLEDNDVNLVSQVIFALGRALGLAVDKAIVYGTGTKMPMGIVTRLAQTAAPSNYPATARTWVDLHTSNIQKITAANSVGIKLFQSIIAIFGAAKKKYGAGGKFWAMNETTHMKLVAEALAFNANGALVAGMDNQMPVVGGDIVELDFIPDDNIVAGYGELYLMAERAGMSLANSEHAMFIEDKTVYKATARYDGQPVIAEGFVVIGINNVTPTTTVTFAPDAANTAASSGTTGG